MKRSQMVGIVIVSVAIYVGLVIGVRLLLAADKTGNWIAAVAGATGVATAVLTGLLVGVTWSYVRLTSRMVDLEATAPARAAQQQALRDFLNTFATAEQWVGSIPIDAEYVLSVVTIKGVASTELAKAQALLENKVLDSFDRYTQIYAAGHQLPPPLNGIVLGAAQHAVHASRQLHWLAQAIRAEVVTAAEADRQITRDAIKARYNAEVRPKVEPPEAREEWEAIASISAAQTARDALRHARDQATAALNQPPTHQN